MKKAFKYIVLAVCASLSMLPMTAQELPLAPRDSSIKNGVTPNGMSYYLVANPTTGGVADFALIQRNGTSSLGQKAESVARELYLAAHRGSPDRHGNVKVAEDATLYHFDDVILTSESVDSVLLVMMNIVDKSMSQKDSIWQCYTPSDHAVIVSGDIDTTLMAMKIQMLSYMTPWQEPLERQEESWEDSETPAYKIIRTSGGKYVTVSVSWRLPKTPKEYMNTVQPAVYSMFVNELGLVAQERIKQRFRKDNVPAVDISHDYVSCMKSLGDEYFTICASVAPENCDYAVEIIASTMSSLDRGTVTAYEFELAKNRFFTALGNDARKVVKSNSEYVARCASAFLYGGSLTSSKEIYPFLKYRNPDASAELRIFNNIASALLDDEVNLNVYCVAGEDCYVTETWLQDKFQSAWAAEEPGFLCEKSLDSLSFLPVSKQIKLKSVKKDPISGGSLWTFTNGFKVVYKRQDTGFRMYYALALNGGYGNIRGLSKGEGVHVSDYLRRSKVAGVTGESFHRVLEEYGMTLHPTVNLSNTIIQGSAPQNGVDMMMQALLAFVNEREYDQSAFEYYKSCQDVLAELVEGSAQDRLVAVDSLLWPGYRYPAAKISGALSDDFPQNVEGFWKHQAGKTNDGVLVLIGNVEETRLRKLIQSYIGGFSTTSRVYPRVNISSQPVSGSTTYDFAGEKNSIDVAMTLHLPFSADNYMASHIAVSILEQNLSKAVSGTGMSLRVTPECRIYPHERLNVIITLEESDSSVCEERKMDTSEILTLVREQLDSLDGLELYDEDIQKYKDVLKEQHVVNLSDPQYWIHAIIMRHLDGKDLTTSYESRVDEITAEKVVSILSALSSTSRIEYIVNKE